MYTEPLTVGTLGMGDKLRTVCRLSRAARSFLGMLFPSPRQDLQWGAWTLALAFPIPGKEGRFMAHK
jgi:hypothetical protein